MIAAIEVYNKPDFLYRGETFAILAINSWELLLKSKWLSNHKNNMRSLYVMETVKNKDGSNSRRKKVKITRSGNPFALSDDQIRERYPLDYQMLTQRCRERYSDFVLNNDYHKVRRIYETDLRYAYARYLDPAKKTSGKKIFYSEAILSQLDKHYAKR